MTHLIRYLPKELPVVLVSDTSGPTFLTLTRTWDSIEGLQLNGKPLSFWGLHPTMEIPPHIIVNTEEGGLPLHDLMLTRSLDELGNLADYDIKCRTFLDGLLKAIIDTGPEEKRRLKKGECFDWILKHGLYCSGLYWLPISALCEDSMDIPVLRPAAKKILEYMRFPMNDEGNLVHYSGE
jgi:hypothetical protein